jgi:hypothetical protein
VTSGSARELPHRLNRYATPQGERRAALATRGDRKWLECAKGGQPEKAPGGRGGDGFASVDAGTATVGGALAVVGPEPERRAPRSGSVTVAPAASMVRHCPGSARLGSSRWSGAGVGIAGAVEELAEVSVVRELWWCVGYSIQFL